MHSNFMVDLQHKTSFSFQKFYNASKHHVFYCTRDIILCVRASNLIWLNR